MQLIADVFSGCDLFIAKVFDLDDNGQPVMEIALPCGVTLDNAREFAEELAQAYKQAIANQDDWAKQVALTNRARVYAEVYCKSTRVGENVVKRSVNIGEPTIVPEFWLMSNLGRLAQVGWAAMPQGEAPDPYRAYAERSITWEELLELVGRPVMAKARQASRLFLLGEAEVKA